MAELGSRTHTSVLAACLCLVTALHHSKVTFHVSMRHAGARFVVGFVSEEGKPVVNEISTGASAIFPVGELSIRSLYLACAVQGDALSDSPLS